MLSGLQWDVFTKDTPFTHSLISFNRLSLIRKPSKTPDRLPVDLWPSQQIHWKNHVLVQKITIYMVVIFKASTEVGTVYDFIIKIPWLLQKHFVFESIFSLQT